MNFWPQSCSQQLSPLKHACKLNPEALPETTDPEYEFEYVDIGNVTLEAGVGDRQTMTFGSAPSRARKPVQPGDILVSTVRTYLKAVAFIGLEADHWVASTGFAVLRPKQVLEPRYLYRVVQSNPFVDAVVAASTGVSYPAINPSALGSINIPLPDLGTQKLIAAFLDREIARIDQLVEKKERFCELLGEKLGQDIGHLLSIETGNLRPEALRWVVRVRSGDFISNTEIEKSRSENAPIAVIGGNGIMAYADKVNAPANTIVVGRVGALCGNVHLVRDPSWVTDNALVVRIITKKVIPEYLVEVIFAANLNTKASRSAQPLITGETVKSLKAKFPSIEKQHAICREITSIRDHCYKLQQLVRGSIDRLYELRSALITAAVTDQIDVASWSKRNDTDRRVDIVPESLA
jgi:type I restriction enzyme S subunit